MEKMKSKDIISSLSINSSNVAACVMTLDEEKSPFILGLGKAEGRLLGSRGVLNIDELSKAIKDSLRKAQSEAGYKSPKVVISITGGSLSSEISRGIVKLSSKGEEIRARHVKAALKIAEAIPVDSAKDILHSIPQDFIVDGQSGISNPTGLNGVKLETETMLVTAHAPFLQNVVKAMNLSGIELEDVVFSGLANYQCLAADETIGQGIVLIEIDNNFTTLSVFYDNTLRGIHIEQESVIADSVLERLKVGMDRIRNNSNSGDNNAQRAFIFRMHIPGQYFFIKYLFASFYSYQYFIAFVLVCKI